MQRVRAADAGRPVELDLATAGVRTHVRLWPAEDSGDAARRGIVLAFHGLTDSGLVFGPLWAAMGRRWTIVAPDAPGHGGTPWPGGTTYDIAPDVATLGSLIDQLEDLVPGAHGCVLMGHSLGAFAALRAATTRRDAVRHLVLEEPVRRPWRRSADRRSQERIIIDLQGRSPERRISVAAGFGWSPAEQRPWADSKLDVDRRIFDVPTVWPDETALLARVTCPVTLALGRKRDSATGGGRRVHRLIKATPTGLRVVRFDTGHNVRREATAEFADMLSSLLRQCSEEPVR